MKKQFTAATLLILAVSFAPMGFAADAGQAFNTCKSEAESNEVSDADIKTFMSNCMTEMEVAAADIKSLVDAEYSGGNQDSAKDAKDE